MRTNEFLSQSTEKERARASEEARACGGREGKEGKGVLFLCDELAGGDAAEHHAFGDVTAALVLRGPDGSELARRVQVGDGLAVHVEDLRLLVAARGRRRC